MAPARKNGKKPREIDKAPTMSGARSSPILKGSKESRGRETSQPETPKPFRCARPLRLWHAPTLDLSSWRTEGRRLKRAGIKLSFGMESSQNEFADTPYEIMAQLLLRSACCASFKKKQSGSSQVELRAFLLIFQRRRRRLRQELASTLLHFFPPPKKGKKREIPQEKRNANPFKIHSLVTKRR